MLGGIEDGIGPTVKIVAPCRLQAFDHSVRNIAEAFDYALLEDVVEDRGSLMSNVMLPMASTSSTTAGTARRN